MYFLIVQLVAILELKVGGEKEIGGRDFSAEEGCQIQVCQCNKKAKRKRRGKITEDQILSKS